MTVDIEVKDITLGDVFDAIEKNGYPQIRGNFIKYKGDDDTNDVIGACAVGQGALNLGVAPTELGYHLANIKVGDRPLSDAIFSRNDGSKWKCKTIATFFRKKLEGQLDTVVMKVYK